MTLKRLGFIHSFGLIKLLADPRRMEVLRLLMAAPSTITKLAHTMKQSPAWVRHHLLVLESAKLVEMSEIRKTGKVTEKFYRANADALFLQEIILPKTKNSVLIFSGSCDLALEKVAKTLSKEFTLLSLPTGSLDGVINLRLRLCQISGSHLRDESGEYNTPFVRHLFPDRNVELITFAHRAQGLMVASSNPFRLKQIQDLAIRGARFVNLNAGSGTRVWLDAELRKLNIPREKINGYDRVVKTHTSAAALIAAGKADAAVGLQTVAYQHKLGFIPLFEERYDLVLPHENKKELMPILDYLQTSAFRAELDALTGYNSTHSGEQIPL